MAGRNRYRRGSRLGTRRAGIVIGIVAAVCAFFVMYSMQEKFGYDFGLPNFRVPSVSAILSGQGDEGSAPDSTATLRDGLELHTLDVGQASSALVVAPGKTVLIDAGENGQGPQVLSYLHDAGIERIDILIGTHPHSDHIGGMSHIVENMEIGMVILPEIPDELIPTTMAYTNLLLAIDEKGLGVEPAKPGSRYDLGGGAYLTVMGPLRDYNSLNNQSVVSRVTYDNTSFLFMGDSERDVEKDLLESGGDLSSDVLTAGHHGSNTSSTGAFLSAVYPRIALISCGRDNNYGHPHREVIERLEELGAEILRTDRDGAIVLFSDGKSIGISTEK